MEFQKEPLPRKDMISYLHDFIDSNGLKRFYSQSAEIEAVADRVVNIPKILPNLDPELAIDLSVLGLYNVVVLIGRPVPFRNYHSKLIAVNQFSSR